MFSRIRSIAATSFITLVCALNQPAFVYGESVTYYGNPQVMASLADTQVGDSGNVTYANSVVFPFSKNLVSFRKYFIFVPGNAGGQGYYHGGDGGTIQFSLQSDDGSAAHNPSGLKLASSAHIFGGPPEPNGSGGLYEGNAPPSGAPGAIYGCDETDDANFRQVCFARPVAVTAGEIYHLVADNTGRNPDTDFVSMDDILTRNDTGDRDVHAPVYDDLDFRVSYRYNGEWIHRKEFVAIVEYQFDDGTSWGIGYMEVSPTKDAPAERASKWLSPEQDIRQTFTPESNFTAQKLNVAAMHYSGANTIDASIVDSSGTVLWTGQIHDYPTGALQGAPGPWAGSEPIIQSRFRGVEFPQPIQFIANSQYQIILRSSGGSYVIPGIRDGFVSSKYFGSATTVNGAAFYGNASAGQWTTWELGQRESFLTHGFFDISFYLEMGTPGLPVLTLLDTSVRESAGKANIDLELSHATNRPVTVLVHTRPETAQGGSDYYGWTQSVVFEPGEARKTLFTTILDDETAESTENFSVRLLFPENAKINDPDAIVTIEDDDS